jgi:hypothetical protein
MFEAGLLGPKVSPDESSHSPDKPTVKVRAKMSARPKEEVGRGLLAENKLPGNTEDDWVGLIDPNPPPVTVGENGYQGLTWNGKLTPDALKALPQKVVPKMRVLTELSAFLDAFKRGKATRAASIELALDSVEPSIFQENLGQRLFGDAKGCIVTDIKNRPDEALLEPLFITEVKVLLETATGTPDLFN